MERIKYLLILTDKEPPGGKDYFIAQLLNNLYSKEKPYQAFVDGQTKIALSVVGSQQWDGTLVAATATSHFPHAFGSKPDLDALTYQTFSGQGGNGITILEWEGKAEPPQQQNPCPSCGYANSPGAVFCGGCGHSLKKPSTPPATPETCPTCGTKIENGFAFCSNCGEQVGKPPGTSVTPRKCAKCGTVVSPEADFCRECGNPLKTASPEPTPAATKCPSCGTDLQPGDVFCMECGKKITQGV